ncbi:MAG: bifunctional methylenetetrahydrofolate dehydrogenase/methenyltetrahydrofolate cyclohydrolase FolD, partial [Chloroflexi bacterium]|nr:bifunctional methylenetetrahydrofolate dehydrogenase/methenyltetrahydrofolate cyclohydrolase FolD [Chloroflexota bacterium]
MTAKIIDGNKIAEEIRAEVAAQVQDLKERQNISPGLAVVLVGENPASVSYVTGKAKACQETGIHEETIRLPESTTEEELLALIDRLNQDPHFHGILVQMPLPKRINENKIINALKPEKDVDGFHPVNVGKLLIGEPNFIPCTPHGVQQMLIRSGYDPSGKHVVICGRSNLVGKPLAAILVQKREGANATVTICHTGSKNMGNYTRQGDILVAAAGSPRLITADMVKEGAVVIDVGVNRVSDPTRKSGFRLVGDVDFEAVKEKAEAITPVPGGVGPMTVTMLLVNTV